MEYDIKGKKIVITGGAGDIGYAIADQYLQAGAELVILIDIDEKDAITAANKLNKRYGTDKAVYIKCDVTTDLDNIFEKILKTYKRIDVLVNSAGTNNDSLPKRMIDINVTSLVEWSLKFYEHMRTDKGGSGGTILNISSILGYRIIPFGAVYQMTKFAAQGFTRSLGHVNNFKKTSVRVIALCPGFTNTKLVKNLNEAVRDTNYKSGIIPNDLIAYAKEQIWQEAEDIGPAALEVFHSAKSGTAWLIEGGQPVVEVLHHE